MALFDDWPWKKRDGMRFLEVDLVLRSFEMRKMVLFCAIGAFMFNVQAGAVAMGKSVSGKHAKAAVAGKKTEAAKGKAEKPEFDLSKSTDIVEKVRKEIVNSCVQGYRKIPVTRESGKASCECVGNMIKNSYTDVKLAQIYEKGPKSKEFKKYKRDLKRFGDSCTFYLVKK